nr:zinc finger, CCHC-type, retrotransposon Gag domain protein [Tanacetum cinerariifolium]
MLYSAAMYKFGGVTEPKIRAEIREEFRTGSGPLDSSGNPPPVTIHTWLERFNKQKPRSFEKATAPIRTEIREEFRTGSGPSGSGGNPPPVTIHTWLEHFNKQKPHSFEKATAPVDAKNWISHMEKIFDVMGSFPPTCWIPRSSCGYCGGAGKELPLGSSQVYP